jgi:hypothetical protein
LIKGLGEGFFWPLFWALQLAHSVDLRGLQNGKKAVIFGIFCYCVSAIWHMLYGDGKSHEGGARDAADSTFILGKMVQQE